MGILLRMYNLCLHNARRSWVLEGKVKKGKRSSAGGGLGIHKGKSNCRLDIHSEQSIYMILLPEFVQLIVRCVVFTMAQCSELPTRLFCRLPIDIHFLIRDFFDLFLFD